MQPFNCCLVVLSPNRIIPLWNQVPERTSLMAKGYATIHASTRLALYDRTISSLVDFFPVHYSNIHWPALSKLSLGRSKKALWISHLWPPVSDPKQLSRQDLNLLDERPFGFEQHLRSQLA
jgi:hypothetical protein